MILMAKAYKLTFFWRLCSVATELFRLVVAHDNKLPQIR